MASTHTGSLVGLPMFLIDTLITTNAYKRLQTMPIDLREHDSDDPITVRPGTNKAEIIKLLYEDTNLGYTPSEIQNNLDIPRGSVSTTLSRLSDEGLIGKTNDGLYHGLEHREDISRFASSLVQLDTMFTSHPEAGIDTENVEQIGETQGSR
jgi:Mn-dependent DtxR family transcriptional regulator